MINVDWCDLVQKFCLPFCMDWSFCHKLQSFTSRGSFQQSIIKLLLKSNDWVRLSEHKGLRSCGFRQSTTIFPNSDFWNWTSSIGKAFSVNFFPFHPEARNWGASLQLISSNTCFQIKLSCSWLSTCTISIIKRNKMTGHQSPIP